MIFEYKSLRTGRIWVGTNAATMTAKAAVTKAYSIKSCPDRSCTSPSSAFVSVKAGLLLVYCGTPVDGTSGSFLNIRPKTP